MGTINGITVQNVEVFKLFSHGSFLFVVWNFLRNIFTLKLNAKKEIVCCEFCSYFLKDRYVQLNVCIICQILRNAPCRKYKPEKQRNILIEGTSLCKTHCGYVSLFFYYIHTVHIAPSSPLRLNLAYFLKIFQICTHLAGQGDQTQLQNPLLSQDKETVYQQFMDPIKRNVVL